MSKRQKRPPRRGGSRRTRGEAGAGGSRSIPWRPVTMGFVGVGAVVAIIAAIFVFGSGGDDEIPENSPIAATDESLATGGRLFENNCQLCHGAEGRGGTMAPDLTIHVPTRTDRFLFGRISEGFAAQGSQNTMPAFKGALTETERWHLVNFLREEFGTIMPEGVSR